MATITDLNPTAFNTNSTPTAAEANAKVNLLEEMNGSIESSNLSAGFKVARTHLQRRSLTRGKSYGANANIDFCGDLLWPNYQNASPWTFMPLDYTDSNATKTGLDEAAYLTIPGCSAEMTNVYEDSHRVRLTFRVSYFLGGSSLGTSNSAGDRRYNSSGAIDDVAGAVGASAAYIGAMRLFINGVPHPYIMKRLRGAQSTGIPSNDYKNSEAQNQVNHPDFQVWEFTAVFTAAQLAEWTPNGDVNPLARGNHTASLRVFTTGRTVRIKSRYMDWTFIK